MLSEKIFKQIQEKNIKPKPKWEFVIKNWLILVSGFLFLIISSLVFAVIIYLIQNFDWDLRVQIGHSFLGFALICLPYLWIILLVAFIGIIYYDFKKSKKGYKYSWQIIIGVTILASLLFGILFYNIGIGQAIENFLNKRMPIYQRLMMRRANLWQRPDKGILPGVILKINSEQEFDLKDLKGKEWRVGFENHNRFLLEPGQKIKAIGKKINKQNFKAEQIRPLMKGMHWAGRIRK